MSDTIHHFSEDPLLVEKISSFSLPAEWTPSESSLREALERTRAFWLDDDTGAMPRGFVDALNRSLAELIQAGLETTSIQVGQPFPAFELPDHHGRIVRSADLLDQGPLVVTFYRGGWCPYCNLALRGLQGSLSEITAAGATLVAVSPELPDGTLSTAERNALAFPVLSDLGLKFAHRVGVVWEIPDYALEWHQKFFGLELESHNGAGNRAVLPVPATFVVGRDGLVRWRFVDARYWRRAEPGDVVSALTKGR